MRARCFGSRLGGRLHHGSRCTSVPHHPICPVHSAAESVAPLTKDAPPRQAPARARASDGIGRAQLRNPALPRSHCDQPTVPPLGTTPSFAALRVPLAETEAAAVGAGEVLRGDGTCNILKNDLLYTSLVSVMERLHVSKKRQCLNKRQQSSTYFTNVRYTMAACLKKPH